jgi:hypothetical protein
MLGYIVRPAPTGGRARPQTYARGRRNPQLKGRFQVSGVRGWVPGAGFGARGKVLAVSGALRAVGSQRMQGSSLGEVRPLTSLLMKIKGEEPQRGATERTQFSKI